nr:MAG TPA: hypothetical protein [Caudoviricetes sp.]
MYFYEINSRYSHHCAFYINFFVFAGLLLRQG